MTLFVFGAAALFLIAVVALGSPLWRYHTAEEELSSATDEREAQNVALYLEHLKELNADLEAGRISAEQHQKLTGELKRNLLADQRVDTNKAVRRGGALTFLVAGLVMLVFCLWFYLLRGSSGDVLFSQLQAEVAEQNMQALRNGQPLPVEPTHKLIEALQERVKVRPDNPQYWYLLGRYANQVGRYELAVEGFRGAYKLSPDDPEVVSQLAQALFFASGNQITDEISFLVNRALEINPRDTTALGLAGIEAFGQQNYQGAVDFWQAAVDLTPPGTPGRDALMAGIARARQELSADGKPQAAVHWQLPVRVSLSDELTLPEEGTLFVFVREHQGSPMPLVVQRLPLANLPTTIILNETMAMTTKDRLQTNKPVEVVARISKTGTAVPQPGDMEGLSGPLDMTGHTDGVEIVIDRIL